MNFNHIPTSEPEQNVLSAYVKGTRRGHYQMYGVAKEYPTMKNDDGSFTIEAKPEDLLSRKEKDLRKSLGKVGVTGFKIEEVLSNEGRAVLATPLGESGEPLADQPVLALTDQRTTHGGGFLSVSQALTGGATMPPHVNISHEGKVYFS